MLYLIGVVDYLTYAFTAFTIISFVVGIASALDGGFVKTTIIFWLLAAIFLIILSLIPRSDHLATIVYNSEIEKPQPNTQLLEQLKPMVDSWNKYMYNKYEVLYGMDKKQTQ